MDTEELQEEEAIGFLEDAEEGYFAEDEPEAIALEPLHFHSEDEGEDGAYIEHQDMGAVVEGIDAPIDTPRKHFENDVIYSDDLEDEYIYREGEDKDYSVPIKDKVTSSYFKKMIEEGNPIVEQIVYFNLRRANQIHHTHYAGMGEVLFRRDFLPGILGSRRASLYYTEHLDLLVGSISPKEVWFTDFSEYTTRFALLPGPLLEELSVFLGMMIFHARIRKIIQQDGVMVLRNAFGRKAADFGVRRVPLFLHNIDSLYNMFRLPDHWAIEDLVRESGRYGLGLCVSTYPDVLQKSVLLKLPRGFLSDDEYEPNAIGPDGFSKMQRKVYSNKLFPLLRKILTLEVAPEWTPFFF